jgi:hypothetical protein
MKRSEKSLQELARQIETETNERRDFLVPVKKIRMESDPVTLHVGSDEMAINPYAHGQLAQYLDIPKKYYDRMREEDQGLLAVNVNRWLDERETDTRLVRTLGGRVRAFLSNRFRSLDNFDLAKTTLPVLNEMGCRVVSAELTETRFYLKSVLPSMSVNLSIDAEGKATRTLPNGKDDIIVASLTISNSEVGAGSLKVEAGFYRTSCTNLAIFDGSQLKKYHVGRIFDTDDNIRELLSVETQRADDAALWMKVKDVVKGAFNKDIFERRAEGIRALADRKILAPINDVVEVTRKKFGIGEGLQDAIIGHLVEEGGLTQWNLVNAFTRTAEDCESYDEATELERVGGKIIELSPSEWERIAA